MIPTRREGRRILSVGEIPPMMGILPMGGIPLGWGMAAHTGEISHIRRPSRRVGVIVELYMGITIEYHISRWSYHIM